jgi:hypothetical protein
LLHGQRHFERLSQQLISGSNTCSVRTSGCVDVTGSQPKAEYLMGSPWGSKSCRSLPLYESAHSGSERSRLRWPVGRNPKEGGAEDLLDPSLVGLRRVHQQTRGLKAAQSRQEAQELCVVERAARISQPGCQNWVYEEGFWGYLKRLLSTKRVCVNPRGGTGSCTRGYCSPLKLSNVADG